jgi:hypothetical protein
MEEPPAEGKVVNKLFACMKYGVEASLILHMLGAIPQKLMYQFCCEVVQNSDSTTWFPLQR